ncbi:MAG: gliding motility lipoprotein GldH [Candidatus Symbiothrix sp.]|jgi:gliding motility-associated lipoprotein GldH|nr:gliding motility lipoprotein GldH [Candidatus Symbiothrix sp.]
MTATLNNPVKFGGLLVISMAFCMACGQIDTFSEFHSFPQLEWKQSEAVRFEAPVTDLSKYYDVFIEIRNNNQYPFANLWLFIDMKMPDGTVRSDTIPVQLADVYGKWFGTGIGTYSLSYLYKEHFQYPDTGIYVYIIRQGMRKEILNGISEVGLRIETQHSSKTQ